MDSQHKASAFGLLLDKIAQNNDAKSASLELKRLKLTDGQIAAYRAWLTMYARTAIQQACPGVGITHERLLRAYAVAKRTAAVGPVESLDEVEFQRIEQVTGDALCARFQLEHLREALSRLEYQLCKSSLGLEPMNGSGSTAGDRVEYDAPVKQAFRDTWTSFYARRSTREEIEDGFVICLPSRRPERDLRQYRRLGFEAYQITGVEGGQPETREEFAVRAALHGMRAELGRLEQILPMLDYGNESYSHVNFDFLGPWSRGVFDACSSTPVRDDKVLVVVNTMARREQKLAQDSLEFHCREFSKEAVIEALREEQRRHNRFLFGKRLHAGNVSSLVGQMGALEEQARNLRFSRTETIDFLIVNGFISRLSNVRNSYKELLSEMARDNPGFTSFTLRRFLADIEGDIVEATLQFQPEKPELDLRTYSMFPLNLANDCAFGVGKLNHLEKYEYSSTINGRSSPFLSTMAEIIYPGHKGLSYEPFRHTAHFLLKGAAALSRSNKDGSAAPQIRITDSHGRALKQNDPGASGRVVRTCFVELVVGGSTIARIQFGKYLSDIQEYEKLVSKYPLTSFKNIRAVPRVRIG